MAFLVARRDGRFEIRESVATSRGPRARTLATFHALSEEELDRAHARARGSLDRARIRARAAELGIPVRRDTSGVAARRLVAQLRAGCSPPPAIARELRRMLPRSTTHVPDSLAGALEWLGVSDELRGRALHDLLDLTSRIPSRPRVPELAFPRITSSDHT